MTNIRVLAKKEAAAEATRDKADAAWRKTWWATSLALGKIEGKHAIGEAQQTVRQVTGQSTNWVSRRTRAGRAYITLGVDVAALPPRMAVEVVEAGMKPTKRLVKQMIQAEKDGKTLREFAADLGHPWADTPQGASAATIEQIVSAQPEQVATSLAPHIASKPQVADRIAADDDATEAVVQASFQRTVERTTGVRPHPPITPADPEPHWYRLSRRIELDLVEVIGSINKMRAEGQHHQADRATERMRGILAKGLADLEIIPDTIQGVEP